METRQIKSWQELLSFFEEARGHDIIYRGVTRAHYELLPKVGRAKAVKEGWSKEAEIQVLRNFRRLAQPHLEPVPRGDSDSEWMVIGQHHGLPTRLLDWTTSPLVATFFAVEWSGKKIDVAIYVERLPKSPKVVHTLVKNIFDIENLEFLFPFHITKRIPAQHGVFTVHPNPTTPYDSESLIKLVVPSDLRQEVQLALDAFGINRASLFPDLDGIAAMIAWHFKWQDMVGD